MTPHTGGETRLPPKPARMEVAFDAIPHELKERIQWVMWNWEFNEYTERYYHSPYQPNGKAASWIDPEDWSDLQQVMNALKFGRFDGIGFMVAWDDPYVVISLEDGLHAEEGGNRLRKFDTDLVNKLNSYTQISPCGAGVHVLVSSNLAFLGKARFLEALSASVVLPVTGRKLPDTPTSINQMDGEKLETILRDAFSELMPKQEHGKGDGESPHEPIPQETDQRSKEQILGSAEHYFFDPYLRERSQLPELVQSQIEHLPDGRNGVARFTTYNSILPLLLNVQFGPIGRKDRLLHAAILVAKIETWFSNPKYSEAGFYKFVDGVPKKSRFYLRNYQPGDSWCEELGFSPRMYKAAFALIGTTYKSLRKFRIALEARIVFLDNDGVERLYCAAHDNQKGYTVFYRNHPLADWLFKPLKPPPKKGEEGE